MRNVIFMIPDGMGPAYLNLTRAALLAMGKPGVELALDGIEYGRIRTRSRSDNITDSAAAATAYATGAPLSRPAPVLPSPGRVQSPAFPPLHSGPYPTHGPHPSPSQLA